MEPNGNCSGVFSAFQVQNGGQIDKRTEGKDGSSASPDMATAGSTIERGATEQSDGQLPLFRSPPSLFSVLAKSKIGPEPTDTLFL